MVYRTARQLCVTALASVVLTSCAADSVDRGPAPSARTKKTTTHPVRASDQVAGLVHRMSDQELVGQLIISKLGGTRLTGDERRALASGKLGGVILFGWNDGGGNSLRTLTSSLPRAVVDDYRIAPFVAADQEGGAARALQARPPLIGQPFWNRAGNVAALERLDRRAARELRRSGINVNLAPVADLPLPPANVMRARSFGTQPASRVAAAVRGFQSGMIAATVKHFPGLGGATRNTDDGVARVRRSRAELMSQDLAPFRAAAGADVGLVMTSHAIYDGLGSTRPATIDPMIAGTLLRRELGNDVVVISDSLNARGLRDASQLTTPRLCPAAAAAGVDILLLTGSLETARLCRARLLEAMRTPESGITHASLERSALRVLRLKQKLGLVRAPR